MPVNTYRHLLSCGHTIPRKEHRWVTVNGHDACRLDCVERLEKRGG